MTPVLLLVLARQLAASGEARRRRIAAGLSYRETGDAVGVSQSTILRWERGERSPRGDAAIRYGELLEQLADSKATTDAG